MISYVFVQRLFCTLLYYLGCILCQSAANGNKQTATVLLWLSGTEPAVGIMFVKPVSCSLVVGRHLWQIDVSNRKLCNYCIVAVEY